MEKSSKRGKIPQSDWPLIMARYDSGETLASIARTYDCSPPAISYVVSRSRARQPDAEVSAPAPSATVPQLIKAAASEPALIGDGQTPTATASPVNGQSSDRQDELWPRETNGFAGASASERDNDPPRVVLPAQRPTALPAAPGPANGDHRRTLHLSLGNASQGNGGTAPGEHRPAEQHIVASDGQQSQHLHPQQQILQPQTAGERFAPPAKPELQDRGGDGANGAGFSEARSAVHPGPVQRTDSDVARRKEGTGSYIDQELRARVDGDIAAFLAAFDAALLEDTQQSRSALREATDRLLRAGARTRIELERLEARTPLPPRDTDGRSETAWRHR